MAKLSPANLDPNALPRIHGVFYTRISRGVIIAQTWPRKRGKPTNWNIKFTSQQFKLAAQMASNSEPLQLQTAIFLTKGSSWMPRDLLLKAAYGSAYEVTVPNFGLATVNSHAPPPE
jgi:hypothetical protein